jgi:hypothetical protein
LNKALEKGVLKPAKVAKKKVEAEKKVVEETDDADLDDDL